MCWSIDTVILMDFDDGALSSRRFTPGTNPRTNTDRPRSHNDVEDDPSCADIPGFS